MKQFDEKDTFKQDFQGIKKKVTPSEKEKYDIFHQLNTKMDQRVRLDSGESEEQNASPQRAPLTYYVSLGIVATIVFLLFIPTWFPLSDDDVSDDNTSLPISGEEGEEDVESTDQDILDDDHLLVVEDIVDLDMVSMISLMYQGEMAEMTSLFYEGVDDLTTELLQHLKGMEIEEGKIELSHLYDDGNYSLQLFHDDNRNTMTTFHFLANREIYIQSLNYFTETNYLISDGDMHKPFKWIWAIASEQEAVKNLFDNSINDTCGYEKSDSVTYRFNFALKNGSPPHPIPCIQPIFDDAGSEIFIGTTFFGSTAQKGFYYSEQLAGNLGQGVVISIQEHDIEMKTGTRESVLKETDHYSIYKEKPIIHLGEEVIDNVYVASGDFNEDLYFHIIIFDREKWFSEKEIIRIMEEQLIPDVLGAK